MTFDVEQVKPSPFLKPKYFRFERNPRIFACHPLPQQDIETVINEWKRQDEEKKKKRIPVYRYAFILYHKHFLEHQRLFQSLRDSRCVDIGEARQWLIVIETFPLDFSRAKAKMKQLQLSINNQQLTIEILEWMQCAERQGYILHMNDCYKENEHTRYCKMSELVSVKKRRVNVDLLAARMAKSNSFKCSQLRLFFDQRATILFDPKDIINLKERSAREIPQIFKNRIENFVAELTKRFLQDLPKKETRRKMFEITLIQESTKLAFHTIRNYIGFLQRENDIINIDSNLVGKRIFFPLEQLKEYFKEPILHLANIEWVRFSSTDVDHWTDLIGQIIMDQLDQEKITNSPILKQFLFFIQDEKISEAASIVELIAHVQNLNTLKLRLEKAPEKLQHLLFTIRLKKVWQAIQLRLQTVYKRLIQRLTSDIAQQIEELQCFFRKDVRILSFRSINPAQMLSNKATVDDMLDNDIPNHGKLLASIYDQILVLTQHILLDSNQDEALIKLSTTCRSLPKLIEHHHQFFIRRLGTFQLFVNKRQKCVQSTSQKLSEKLRILQTMAIPQDSETYLTEISNLKPTIQELLNDLSELNRFEKVIGTGVTELPRHKQAAEHMNVMEQLFSCTVKYFQVVNDFFESHRTSVNIHSLSIFISDLLKQLSEFERCLVGQRASRLFIGQLRNDVDAFKKNFAVMEIMSCPRLLDNHWSKMSEIMSFDMSAYANSSVSVLCELGLEKHLSQLKPIVFAAEREAHVIDHLDDVIAYWTTALFDIEEIKYWHLKRPTNLKNLLNDAKKDVEILHDIRDTDASPPHISDNLNKWTSTVEKLKEILENWYVTWEDWHKVARLFERSRFELNEQFKLFRECAKYWKKLVENLIGDSSVLRILELKHVQCWLKSISGMMLSITQNLGHLMERIRSNFTRLTIVSDYHLLILLSAEDSVEALSQFVQLVFPHLRNIQFTSDGFMELHDHSGDRMILEELTYDSCKRMSCCDLIEKIEETTFRRIVEVLSDEQHMEYGKHSNKMLKHLSNELFSHKKIPDELCVSFVDEKFVLETSSHVQQSNLILEFVHLNCKQISLPRNLCQFWADGNIILLIGSLSLTRNVLSNIISKLYVSYHFVNCHEDLDVAVIQRVVEASAKESVLIIMENLNLLSASGLHNLFSTMRKRVAKQPFPRLFLTSCEPVTSAHMPMCVTPYKITKDILPVEEKLEIQLFNENDNEPSDFDVSVIVPKKVLTPIEILADRLKTRNISACVGSLAKSFLRKSQEFLKQKLEWFYIDGLTKYQSIRKCTGFGGEYEGVLLDVLTKNGILSYEEGCEELKQIIVFYGYTNIWQILPILNTLFLRFDDNIVPKTYLTLADGSTIICPLATHCVLCIPDFEDSKQEFLQSFGIPYEVYNSDLMNSLFETYELFWRKKFQNILVSTELMEPLEIILRKVLSDIDTSKQHADVVLHLLYQEFSQITPSDADALIMASVILIDNFLTIYADLPEELDALIHKRLTTAVSCARLPERLSEWKLSSTDLSKLVKWQDQPYYRSSLEKEDRLSDLVVVWPALDRMIYYGLRLLSLGRNLIVSGSSYSQKSTFVKMLGKQLEREPDVSISFHWLGNESRTSLENVQKMFVRVVEDAKINETKYIVVDKFSVAEPLLAVLELFVDCGAYYQNEKRVTTERQLKFILITEDEDWMSLEDNHALWDTFSNLPMKSLTFDELQLLVYQLVNWNLNLKSFSTEYQKVLDPISYGTVFLATRAYVPFAVLSVCMRIVKGLQFAFPDNSPDTPSFVRLWVHECLRVIMDGLDNDQIPMLIEDMKSIIREQFNMTEEDLLKELNCWSTDDDEQLLDEKAVISVISLQTLLYSEMDVTDTYDGLSYVPVKSMVNFNRIMENFLFEYHKNHKRDRIQLSINNEITACVQQISRIIRQTGEHLCLCGLPGQGRSQMVTLAAAANSAQLISHYPDVHSFETFVKGWYEVFTRSILSILSSNQQVCILVHMDFNYARVEPRWMDYLRLWLERPETSRIVSDEQLIACGEQLIENEKSLAAQMQSVGIRLPGQRLCRFLAIEVLKEPQTLRRIMESRIHDLIHVVFLVSHHVKSDFSWCSVIHVKSIDESRYDSVTCKILQDAKIESEVNAVVIHQLYQLGLSLLGKAVQMNSESISDFALLYHIVNQAAQVYERKHLQYSENHKSLSAALLTLKKVRELKTAAEQLDSNLLSERIMDKESQLDNTEKDIMLKTETLERLLKKTEDAEKVIEEKKKLINELQKTLDGDLTEPENNYHKAIESLNRFSANDYRSYSQLPKPSIGSRYVAEVLQIIVGPEFKRKTNKAENWVQLQKMLRTPQFFTRILKFEPASLSMEKLSKTLKYVENREFRPVKMRTECELAAELSIWIQSLVKLSSTLKNLREKRNELGRTLHEVEDIQMKNSEFKIFINSIQDDLTLLNEKRRQLELDLSSDRKLSAYQRHSGLVLNKLGNLEKKWIADMKAFNNLDNDLFGISCLQSIYVNMVANESRTIKQRVLDECLNFLKNRQVIQYANPSCPDLAMEFIRNLEYNRRFALFIDENDVLLKILLKIFAHAATIDVEGLQWLDEDLCQRIVRHLSNSVPLIIYNVSEAPPVEYYSFLSKWDEKEILFQNVPHRHPDDVLIILIARKIHDIPEQLARIIDIFTLNEKIYLIDALSDRMSEQILNILKQKSASEILESDDNIQMILDIVNSNEFSQHSTILSATDSLKSVNSFRQVASASAFEIGDAA